VKQKTKNGLSLGCIFWVVYVDLQKKAIVFMGICLGDSTLQSTCSISHALPCSW